MSKKFIELTRQYLMHQYLFESFSPRMTGAQFSQLIKDWTDEREACGITKEYPFETEIFQRTHPLADEAIDLAQKKLSRG